MYKDVQYQCFNVKVFLNICNSCNCITFKDNTYALVLYLSYTQAIVMFQF